MAIKYNVVQRGNPQKRDELQKCYAQVNSDGEVSFKELGEAITQLCSVHSAAVLTVLVAFGKGLTAMLNNLKFEEM
jgi:hypothetical protein